MPTMGEIEWRDRFESNDSIRGSKFHNDSLMGYGGNDTIDGEAGNDTIDGGGDQDVLNGGAGMDLLYGRDGADTLDGGQDGDNLIGWSGDDRLDGGTGADTMAGGRGDDVYYVDHVGDVVDESAGEGFDTVYSGISHKLASNVEDLALLESPGATHGTGNGLDNRIRGNTLNNTLSGGAGNDFLEGLAGADRLIGGSGNDALLPDTNSGFSQDASSDTLMGGVGNDSYAVMEGLDVVVENSDEGSDLVFAFIDYALTAHVENLILYSTAAGGSAMNGTGNDLANVIYGNSADNVLDGAAGNDLLYGWAGADTLIGGTGDDTLIATVYAEVLTGGSDADTFQLDSPIFGSDTVTDFVSGTDRIAISHWSFSIAGTGTLAANGVAFVLGAAATGAGATMMFDSTTHQVLWDADGTGAGAVQALATLAGVNTMSANDFLIV
jgi:Ca2+-binding RTX toxin-like protein